MPAIIPGLLVSGFPVNPLFNNFKFFTMKKTFLFLMAVAMLSLTSCGGGQDTDTATDADAEVEQLLEEAEKAVADTATAAPAAEQPAAADSGSGQ